LDFRWMIRAGQELPLHDWPQRLQVRLMRPVAKPPPLLSPGCLLITFG
jgi:hypothetical protein